MAITVKTFYDEHPINETEILEKLAKDGIARDAVTAEDLSRYDIDHYGGLEATDALVSALGIEPGARVLDLCSGMGGTSRYLAYKYGATVLGVDVTVSRVEGARHLTALVGLDDRIEYQVGDAANLDLAEDSVDFIVSQESFLHIVDRASLFAGCYRTLRPGGRIGFTDVICFDGLSNADRETFARYFASERLASIADYEALMTDAGFADIASADLSAPWRDILHDRLDMYRSLEKETVARFGQERFDTYIGMYEFFVGSIDAGTVGGARFTAGKP